MPPKHVAPEEPPTTNGAQPLQAAERIEKPFSEIGSTGLRRFGWDIAEEFDPNLRGIRGVRVFEEMQKNDPDVGAILFAITNVALQADWTSESASQETPDVEASDFLTQVLFEDMSFGWRDFLVDALTSLVYGWAYFELVFKQRLGLDADPVSIFDDGRIGIRKIAIRGQESLHRWQFDDKGGIAGMWQRAAPLFQEVFIPIEKSLLIRTTREKNNPEGYSLLRNAYKPYYIKKNLEEIELIGAERDMTGVLKIMLPANANEADHRTAQDMGERYKMDDQAYFILQRFGEKPHEQWDVDTVKAPGAKIVDTNLVIQRYSVNIARTVLAQFLTLGQGRVGSFALSKSQQDLFHLAVKGMLDTLEEELNMFLVPKLFRLNEFPGITAYPKIRHSDLGDVDLELLTNYLNVIGALGFLAPTQELTEHLYKRGGLPKPPDDMFQEPMPAPDQPTQQPGKNGAPEPSRVPATAGDWARWYLR